MSKNVKLTFAAFATCIVTMMFSACNNKTASAASVAQRWCELNGVAHRAPEGAEKDAAKKELKDYEKSIEADHKDDKTFMSEVEKEVEKCEAASEGR